MGLNLRAVCACVLGASERTHPRRVLFPLAEEDAIPLDILDIEGEDAREESVAARTELVSQHGEQTHMATTRARSLLWSLNGTLRPYNDIAPAMMTAVQPTARRKFSWRNERR